MNNTPHTPSTYNQGTMTVCAKHHRWVAYDDGRQRACPECPKTNFYGTRNGTFEPRA